MVRRSRERRTWKDLREMHLNFAGFFSLQRSSLRCSAGDVARTELLYDDLHVTSCNQPPTSQNTLASLRCRADTRPPRRLSSTSALLLRGLSYSYRSQQSPSRQKQKAEACTRLPPLAQTIDRTRARARKTRVRARLVDEAGAWCLPARDSSMRSLHPDHSWPPPPPSSHQAGGPHAPPFRPSALGSGPSAGASRRSHPAERQ